MPAAVSSFPSAKSPDSVAGRLARVRERIDHIATESGRDASQIHLIAVSKKQPIESLEAALAAGQNAFGENYLQDALPKIDSLAAHEPTWHFVGDIQSNKTSDIATQFDWAHALDRAKIARRLSDQRPDDAEPLDVCIQVNVDDVANKAGVAPDACHELATLITALPGLRLRGLMTLPEPRHDMQAQRQPFAELARVRDTLNDAGHELDVLSMGMTADLEAAILEGATHVRVGTDVFGQRLE